MAKKLGRPKKPRQERRSKPLRILMNDDERAAVEAAAQHHGAEASTWARTVLLAEARKTPT